MSNAAVQPDRELTAIGVDGSLDHTGLEVAVYGLGPTGLALSVLCGRVFASVTAADTDTTRVTAIQHGQSPVSDPLLSAYLTEATETQAVRVTTELPAAAAEATVHLVAVPTGLREDDAPDLSQLRATVRDIASELSAGDMLVITTPVPPGTTEGVVASIVCDESDLEPQEFGLAVCALPTDRSLRAIRTEPHVVAGSDARSQAAVRELFSAITTGSVSTTPQLRTAECLEAVERSATEMLRSLTNELALSAPDLEVPAVAELISMRTDLPVPGPGVDATEPVGTGFLRDALVKQTPVLDSVYAATQRFPQLIAETVLAAIDEDATAGEFNLEETDFEFGNVSQTDSTDDTLEEPTVLVLGVPTADSTTADSMPTSQLIRELTRAETRPLICDPVADLPRSLTPHTVSVHTATRLEPDAVVILSFRLAFEDLEWSVFDDAVVIDCCGAGLDVDTEVHRLGASMGFSGR